MGQSEIMDWLTGKREDGDHSFFTVRRIVEELRPRSDVFNIRTVRSAVNRLHSHGVVEVRVDWGSWVRGYRASERHVKALQGGIKDVDGKTSRVVRVAIKMNDKDIRH